MAEAQKKTPSPRQQRSLETRAKVLRAAIACVSEEGFAAAHTNRIAARAGVTWGVIQYHFGDKNGLLDALLEEGMKALEEGFAKLRVEGDDAYERVCTVVDGGWRIFTSPLSLAVDEIEINTRTLRQDDPAHVQTLLRMNERLEDLALEALAKALGHAPSPGVYGAFVSTLRGFAMARLMARIEIDFSKEREALARMIVEASR